MERVFVPSRDVALSAPSRGSTACASNASIFELIHSNWFRVKYVRGSKSYCEQDSCEM